MQTPKQRKQNETAISRGNLLLWVPLIVHPAYPPLHQPSMEPPHPLCSLHKRQPNAHASSRHDRGRRNLALVARAVAETIGQLRHPSSKRSAVFGRCRPARNKERRRAAARQYGGRSSPERTSSWVWIVVTFIVHARNWWSIRTSATGRPPSNSARSVKVIRWQRIIVQVHVANGDWVSACSLRRQEVSLFSFSFLVYFKSILADFLRFRLFLKFTICWRRSIYCAV